MNTIEESDYIQNTVQCTAKTVEKEAKGKNDLVITCNNKTRVLF